MPSLATTSGASSSGARSPSGLRSPALGTPRSEAAVSPRPTFKGDELKPYIKKLLSTTLQSQSWPEPRDRDRTKAWIKEIGERVKERMCQMQPTGFKYIVLTQINENLGQGGRADMVSHWEDSDVVVQEVYVNDSLVAICIALAIRA